MEGIKCDVKGCRQFGQTGGINASGNLIMSGDWVTIVGPLGTYHAHNYEHASELASQLDTQKKQNDASELADAQARMEHAAQTTPADRTANIEP